MFDCMPTDQLWVHLHVSVPGACPDAVGVLLPSVLSALIPILLA